MKVLLTGATGFLGSEIARELVRQGHAVRVLVRKTSKLDNLEGLEIERVEGDILDRASVDRALDGVNALIHTAGNVSHRSRDRALVRSVNIEGTRTVLGAALAKGGLRVVHTSSIAAVGATRDAVLQDETSEWTLGGHRYYYGESKREAEELALDFAKKGLDVVVLNPGMIWGPGDIYGGSTKYVLEYLKGVNRVYPRGGNSTCDVRDVAKAHVAALTQGRSGERYIVAGQNVTFKEMLETLERLTGLSRPLPMPYAIAYTFALISEALAAVKRHGLEEVNRGVIRLSKQFFFVDVSKAARDLGYKPRPFEETVRDTVKNLLERGLVKASTPQLEAIAGFSSEPAAQPVVA